MKKIISTTAILFLFIGTFSSCSNSAKTAAAVYQCPMKCEGEKTYDKAGDCAVCGMALEEVKK